MRIAVLGGSFNPFHIGHALLAETVIRELHYDKVLIVPTFIPPHKTMTPRAKDVSSLHRFNMVKAFCDSVKEGYFLAEDCEIKREGVSYTCDTLEYICKKYQKELDGKPAFIMGDEIAAEFDKWKNPEKIASLAELIITHRYPEASVLENQLYKNKARGSYKGDFNVAFKKDDFKYAYTYMPDPLLPVSSTEIRERIRENKGFRFLIPSAVYEYIVENNLYQD